MEQLQAARVVSEAARDQGWVREPRDEDELVRARRELSTTGPPLADDEGLSAVAETRRILEEARKAKQ